MNGELLLSKEWKTPLEGVNDLIFLLNLVHIISNKFHPKIIPEPMNSLSAISPTYWFSSLLKFGVGYLLIMEVMSPKFPKKTIIYPLKKGDLFFT